MNLFWDRTRHHQHSKESDENPKHTHEAIKPFFLSRIICDPLFGFLLSKLGGYTAA